MNNLIKMNNCHAIKKKNAIKTCSYQKKASATKYLYLWCSNRSIISTSNNSLF